MQIRQVLIKDFRCIEKLEWSPKSDLNCILGSGDIGKSTILDAIELTLSPKRAAFYDSDFPRNDITKTIEIHVTVGELPKEVFDEKRMGLYLRGWTSSGIINDEPTENDEPVVTIRLTVNESLDPTWEVITDRRPPRPISTPERALFGLVRLGSETDSIFAWGQYSLLTRMSLSSASVSEKLTQAYRQARDLIKDNPVAEITDAALRARIASISFGAYVGSEFSAGLDTQKISTSLATLTLHNEGVPIKMSGLGTRRLTALAIQRLAVPEGGIILIDEFENGLEPHRVRHALKVLRDQIAVDKVGKGQVILTTHSSITVEELKPQQLAIVCKKGTETKVCTPPDEMQPLIRSSSQAFLGRKIIVCEGKTEIGLIRGLRDFWASRHENEPMEYHGTVLANGEGSNSPARALQLARLGYEVCIFVDSDVPLSDANRTELGAAGVLIFEWPDKSSTEDILFKDISSEGAQSLLEIAYKESGDASLVITIIANAAGSTTIPTDPNCRTWRKFGKSSIDFRMIMASAINAKKYFKRIEPAEEVGMVLSAELRAGGRMLASTTLDLVENWAYDL